jgi:hypothetical protein
MVDTVIDPTFERRAVTVPAVITVDTVVDPKLEGVSVQVSVLKVCAFLYS